jgi:cation diffusion facilitator family transporter
MEKVTPGADLPDAAAAAAAAAGRRRSIVRVLLWVLVPNLSVAAAKLAYGLSTGTLSATSDGLHSLLDGAGNIVGIVAVTFAARPADPGHPYGHRKFETLAALVVSVMLVLASAAILRGAWERLAGRSAEPEASWLGAAVILTTMVVNVAVYRAERSAGRRLSSEFLIADSLHTASDLYASTSVLIAMLGLALGAPWLDPIAAILIVGLLARAAWQILVRAAGALADAAVIDPVLVEKVARSVPGVSRPHAVRSRGAADHVFVDLHLEVSPRLPTSEAHRLAHDVETALRGRLGIADVVVHVEPEGRCR